MKALDVMRVVGLSMALASATLMGCDRAESETPDTADAAADAHDHDGEGHTHDEGAHDDGGEDTPTDEAASDAGDHDMEAFATRITAALAEGDTASVLKHVKGVGLPEGWQGMITPMLASMGGQELESGIKPVSDFSREDLQWPEGDLPEALAGVEHILEVEWSSAEEDGDSESGRFTFPMTQEDGVWRLLLVGPGA